VKKYVIIVVLTLTFCSGCSTDDRVKRAASLLNVKTQTADKEFTAAQTDADKVKIATEFFRTASEFTQVIEDYLFKNKPKESTTPRRSVGKPQ
jgi:hypothetical protein